MRAGLPPTYHSLIARARSPSLTYQRSPLSLFHHHHHHLSLNSHQLPLTPSHHSALLLCLTCCSCMSALRRHGASAVAPPGPPVCCLASCRISSLLRTQPNRRRPRHWTSGPHSSSSSSSSTPRDIPQRPETTALVCNSARKLGIGESRAGSHLKKSWSSLSVPLIIASSRSCIRFHSFSDPKENATTTTSGPDTTLPGRRTTNTRIEKRVRIERLGSGKESNRGLGMELEPESSLGWRSSTITLEAASTCHRPLRHQHRGWRSAIAEMEDSG
eukprot:1231724-Rhodomonas_salina.1